MEIRLNKFINDSGYCSRREADRYIENRSVTVNGKIATLGTKVTEKDTVRVNGMIIESQTEYVYLALNKPVGISSTTDTTDKTNVIDFVNYPSRIFHIGRLDKDSEGLLLLTNDGDIVNKILRAGNSHEKEYEVWVDKPIDEKFVAQMSRGVKILGTVTKKCKVEQEGAKNFRITLTQGLNRQIRRMCSALGFEVTRLKRVRIMNIKLAPLGVGQWRYLSDNELAVLMDSIKDSDGLESASSGAGAGKQTSSKPKTTSKSKGSDHSNGDEKFRPLSARSGASGSKSSGKGRDSKGRDFQGGGAKFSGSKSSNSRSSGAKSSASRGSSGGKSFGGATSRSRSASTSRATKKSSTRRG